MLEKIRENAQGKVAWAIVIIICSTFVMWGVTDYLTQSDSPSIAAKVGGEKITWQLIEANYQRSKEQYDALGFEENVARMHVRDTLIQKHLLLKDIRSLGFRVNDEQVAAILLKIPVFQVDGKFSKDRYLDVLSRANYTDVAFRRDLEKDVLLEQLKEGLARSNFVLPMESKKIIELAEQNRDFGYFILPTQKFKSDIKVTSEQIKSHYFGLKTQFIKPEKVSLEYVELSLNDIAQSVKIPENDLKAYYQEHIYSFSAPERIHARHILIPANAASKEEDAKAETKATEILAKIKAGADFAALAKEHSIDVASAEKGGDIGWFTKGQMVPAFEEAAFGLQESKETAGPIKTQYGYHIIQLIARKPAETRPFEEVRMLILEQCQKDKGQEIFNEKAEKLAKLAFENPKNIEPIALALGLSIQETELFSRKTDKDSTEKNPAKISSYPAIQKAAFSDVVLTKKNNSDPIQLQEGVLAVIHLKKHEPAAQLALEQVEQEIRESILLEKTKQKAKEVAEAIQKRTNAGEDPAVVAKELQLKWDHKTGITRKSANINANILMAAFQTPYKKEGKSSSIVSLPSGDTALLIIDKVTPGNIDKMDAQIKDTYQKGLLQLATDLEFNLYVGCTSQNGKVIIPESTKKH